jgi:hypothetical protein
MTATSVLRRWTLVLACASAALAAAGCSAGDIALEGKVFDYMGIGSNSENKGKEPRVAERSGLVLPPNLNQLPQPGSGQEDDGQLATLDDPDRKKVTNKAELERRQAEYCKVHYEQAKTRGDTSADNATGPLGACRPSIFTSLEKWNKGE